MTLNEVIEGVRRIDYIVIHVKPSFKTLSGSKDQSFIKDDSGRPVDLFLTFRLSVVS